MSKLLLKGYYKITVYNSKKKKMFSFKGKCRSFTKWFGRWLLSWFRYANDTAVYPASYTCPDMTNTNRNLPFSSNTTAAGWGRITSSFIIFGSSDTPFSPEQNTLGSQINSGFSVISSGTPVFNEYSQYCEVVLSRTIQNTASELVIKEIGMYFQAYPSGDANYRNFLLCRDVLTSPITLPSGWYLTITFKFKLQY